MTFEADEPKLDPLSVPPEFVKEGADWLAVFNPNVPRVMDVALAHTFVHDHVICSVKLSADATLLAAGSNGTVVIHNLVDRTQSTFPLIPIDTKQRAHNYARAVTFDPHDKYVVAGSEDKVIRVWCLQSGQLIRTLPGHRREVYAVEFSADNRTLVSASGDRTLRLWDMDTVLDPQSDPTSRVLVPSEGQDKSSIAFTSVALTEHAGRTYVAAGSLDGGVRIWDATIGGLGEVVQTLREHEDSVYSVKFVDGIGSRRGLGMVSASVDRTLKRWELELSQEKGESACGRTLTGHKDAVLATATVREGQYYRVASASKDGSVRLWDLKTGATLFVVHGHKNTVTAVDLSKDGKRLVSGSGDKEVRVWSYTII